MSSAVNEAGNEACFRAEAVPSAKQDARAFERWFTEASLSWPADLHALGYRANLALKTVDVQHPPNLMVREAAKDMAAFLEAYAAHIAKGD